MIPKWLSLEEKRGKTFQKKEKMFTPLVGGKIPLVNVALETLKDFMRVLYECIHGKTTTINRNYYNLTK
jgi:hypothetical protein